MTVRSITPAHHRARIRRQAACYECAACKLLQQRVCPFVLVYACKDLAVQKWQDDMTVYIDSWLYIGHW